jgi:hypothetical protein
MSDLVTGSVCLPHLSCGAPPFTVPGEDVTSSVIEKCVCLGFLI